jgi:hypothetical protein
LREQEKGLTLPEGRPRNFGPGAEKIAGVFADVGARQEYGTKALFPGYDPKTAPTTSAFVPAAVGAMAPAQTTAESILAEQNKEMGAPPVPTRPASPGGGVFEGQARDFTRSFTDEGVRYEAPGGNFLEGRGTGGGGGNLSIMGDYSGPTSTAGMTDAQKADFETQRQADIQKNVALYNAQSDALRKGIANQRAAQGVTPRTAGSDIARPTMQDDLQDYMGGAVGTEGYRRIRNMRMDYNAQRDEAMKGLDRKGRAAVADEFAQNDPMAQIIRAGTQPQDTGYDPYQMARLGIDTARFQADQQDRERRFGLDREKMEREDQRLVLEDRKQMQSEVNDYVKRAGEKQDINPSMNQLLISESLRLAQKHGIPPEQMDNKIRAELARAQAAAAGTKQRVLTAVDIQKIAADAEAQLMRGRGQ